MRVRVPVLVARLPNVWAAVYTTGLSTELRRDRRAEIASDTYEHTHDPEFESSRYRLAWDVLQSTCRGIPEDLRWRASHLSLTGSFAQSALAALPIAAVIAWVTYHTTNNILFGGSAGVAAEVALTAGLLALSIREEQSMISQPSVGSKPTGIDLYLTSAALLLFPMLVIAAMLIIPMAGGSADPAGDEANLTDRAKDTGRWVGGFSLMALGWGIGMLGIAGLGGIVRRAGATALGTIGPALFAIGAIAIIAGGHGAVGLGLGATVDAGGDGVAYLEVESQMGILYSWLGGITAGVGLLTTAAGIWRAKLLTGWALVATLTSLGVASVLFGMLTGHGVNAVAVVAPVAALVGFGLVVRHLTRGEGGAAIAPPLQQPI